MINREILPHSTLERIEEATTLKPSRQAYSPVLGFEREFSLRCNRRVAVVRMVTMLLYRQVVLNLFVGKLIIFFFEE